MADQDNNRTNDLRDQSYRGFSDRFRQITDHLDEAGRLMELGMNPVDQDERSVSIVWGAAKVLFEWYRQIPGYPIDGNFEDILADVREGLEQTRHWHYQDKNK